ncbi:MAG: nucleotide exchange factor GrpE [Streptomycetales bacterium]
MSSDAGEPPSTGDELVQLRAQRDRYLEQLRRTRADFDNYRKRMLRRQTEHLERASENLVRELLPTLDAVELAAAHHPEVARPLWDALLSPLEAEGLERLAPGAGAPFDPRLHEAVEHEGEPAEPGADSPTVVTLVRSGYRFKRRLLRPAMVTVRG